MIREHYAAVKALIPAPFTVYLFDTPANPSYPYVVLWGDAGLHGSETLVQTPQDLTLNLRATCVGANYESCLIVLDAVRAALNRAVPTVAGRKVHELWQEPLVDVRADRDVVLPATGTHPIYAVDGYLLRSEPA